MDFGNLLNHILKRGMAGDLTIHGQKGPVELDVDGFGVSLLPLFRTLEFQAVGSGVVAGVQFHESEDFAQSLYVTEGSVTNNLSHMIRQTHSLGGRGDEIELDIHENPGGISTPDRIRVSLDESWVYYGKARFGDREIRRGSVYSRHQDKEATTCFQALSGLPREIPETAQSTILLGRQITTQVDYTQLAEEILVKSRVRDFPVGGPFRKS